MTNPQLIQALKDLRNTPEFGSEFGVAERDAHWHQLMSRLRLETQTSRQLSVVRADRAAHGLRQVFTVLVRPLALGVSVMALLLGGWSATVNASVGTLPGDTFYSLKLVSERVQIRLARAEARPKLHAEFASRRLQEISEISVSGRVDTKDQLRAAIASFKSEMSLAQASLKEVQSTEPEEVAAIALVLDQKNQEFTSFIERSSSIITNEIGEEVVQDVKDVVAANTQEVHEALVETHEQHASTSTEQTLEQTFQNSYRETQTRFTHITQRVDVLAVIEPIRLPSVSVEVTVGEWRQVLLTAKSQQDEANRLFAVGGFRRAFELIHETEASLSVLEQSIAAVEILLTAPAEDVTDETPETSSSGEITIQSFRSTGKDSSAILEPSPGSVIDPVE